MILHPRASISPPDGPEQPIEISAIPAPRTWLWTVLYYPFLQAIKCRWGFDLTLNAEGDFGSCTDCNHALPPSTFQPPGLRTQVPDGQAFLAPTAKASGAFHLSCDKGCSRCAVQGSGLDSAVCCGFVVCLHLFSLCVDALLGKETEPGHARLLSDLSLCLRPAPPARGKRLGSLRKLASCQLFSKALWCVFSSPILKSEGDKLFSIHYFFPFFLSFCHGIVSPNLAFSDYIPLSKLQHNLSDLAVSPVKHLLMSKYLLMDSISTSPCSGFYFYLASRICLY